MTYARSYPTQMSDSTLERETMANSTGNASILHLLRVTRAQCHAAVAFVALRDEFDDIEVVALPSESEGSELTLDQLETIARHTLDDPFIAEERAVVRVTDVVKGPFGRDAVATRMAVAPLHSDSPGQEPWGLLCALDPVSGEFSSEQLDLLARFAVRFGNHVRARRQILNDILALSPDGGWNRPAPAYTAHSPARSFEGAIDVDGYDEEEDVDDADVVEVVEPLLERFDRLEQEGEQAQTPVTQLSDRRRTYDIADTEEAELAAPTADLNTPMSDTEPVAPPDAAVRLGAFIEKLDESLRQLNTTGRPGALLVIQMDADEGDGAPISSEEVAAAATQLFTQSRFEDIVTRIGTGMFALLMPLRPGTNELSGVQERFSTSVSSAASVAGRTIPVRSSLVLIDSERHVAPEDLLFRAVRQLDRTA